MPWVLIYDTNVERLNQCLTSLLGYQAVGVSDFSAAKRLIIERQPSVVLADWHESCANKLLHEIEQIRDRPITPFYFMEDLRSQAGYRDSRQLALSQGASGFIPRPFSQTELLLAVNAALARANGYRSPAASVLILPTTIQPTCGHAQNNLQEEPFSNIMRLAGGWDVVNGIMRRHGIRESQTDMEELRAALITWGGLPPEDRLLRAIELHDRLLMDCRTAADQVIYDIAYEILYGAGVPGDSKAA